MEGWRSSVCIYKNGSLLYGMYIFLMYMLYITINTYIVYDVCMYTKLIEIEATYRLTCLIRYLLSISTTIYTY